MNFLSFRTKFDCTNKNPQNMLADDDWCNIYHVCVGSRDNIFLCPPGTFFNETKQGCMDRLDGKNCNGTRSYYKPTVHRQKRANTPINIVDKRDDFHRSTTINIGNQPIGHSGPLRRRSYRKSKVN